MHNGPVSQRPKWEKKLRHFLFVLTMLSNGCRPWCDVNIVCTMYVYTCTSPSCETVFNSCGFWQTRSHNPIDGFCLFLVRFRCFQAVYLYCCRRHCRRWCFLSNIFRSLLYFFRNNIIDLILLLILLLIDHSWSQISWSG